MDEDDLREFELALDRHGALSGEDSGRLVDEVRRLAAETAHLRAALHRLRDLGQGMSRTWYLREIEDGLAFPPKRRCAPSAADEPPPQKRSAPRSQTRAAAAQRPDTPSLR